MMYHIKEIINLSQILSNITSKEENKREMPILSKVRFGYLKIGDKFVFNGDWLIKTSEYCAESDKKRNKSSYIFSKNNIVKHEYLSDNCHDDLDEHVIPHKIESKLIPLNPNRFIKKYDLFDDHLSAILLSKYENPSKDTND